MIGANRLRYPRPIRPLCNSRTRSGVVVLEFILVFPVVFLASMAVLQFGIMALVIQTATSAVIDGTRVGARTFPPAFPLNDIGGPDIADEITEKMNHFLGVHGLSIANNKAMIIVERGLDSPVTRGSLAPGFSCTPAGPPPAADEIRVTLCFPLIDPNLPLGAGNPVPDWLATFGFSLAQYKFELSSRASLE